MSTPAQHTPGPWKNGRRADGRLLTFHVTPQAATDHCAAEPADPEHVANMLLLDAAPDLLASLRWALDAMAARNPVWTEGDNYLAARAAIAKATGTAS